MAVIAGIDLGCLACRTALFIDGEVKPFEHRFSEGRQPSIVEDPALAGKRPGLPDLPVGFVSLKQKAGSDDPIVDRNGPRTVANAISELFRQIREDMRVALTEPIDGAVIAVPGFFPERPRVVLREAALDAGFPAVKLFDDALAAVMGAANVPSDGCHLVYGLGAGVFSASVIRITSGKPSVLASAGNKFLGGGDFDSALMGVILEKLGRNSDASKLGDSVIRLRRYAEQLKFGLSKREIEECEVDLGEVFGERGVVKISLTREAFERLIRGAVESTIAQARDAVTEAGLAPGDLEQILLTGGSTRIPLVERLLADEFRAAVVRLDSLGIARGAARQGGLLGFGDWKRRDEIGRSEPVEQPSATPVAALVPTAQTGTWLAMFAPNIQEAERLWNLGHRTHAITAFQGVVRQSSDYLGTLCQQLGESLLHDGDYPRAVLMMKCAVDCNPKDKLSVSIYHRAMNHRAQQLLDIGELKDARNMINDALSLNRRCPGCLGVQARIEKAFVDRSRRQVDNHPRIRRKK